MKRLKINDSYDPSLSLNYVEKHVPDNVPSANHGNGQIEK